MRTRSKELGDIGTKDDRDQEFHLNTRKTVSHKRQRDKWNPTEEVAFIGKKKGLVLSLSHKLPEIKLRL